MIPREAAGLEALIADDDVAVLPTAFGAAGEGGDPDAEALAGLGDAMLLAIDLEVGIAQMGQVGEVRVGVDHDVIVQFGFSAWAAGFGGGYDKPVWQRAVRG